MSSAKNYWENSFSLGAAGASEMQAALESVFPGTFRKATMDEEFQGFDSVYFDRDAVVKIEYKTDGKVGLPGCYNFYIETVSKMEYGIDGWAITSDAHGLVYGMPRIYTVFCGDMQAVKGRVNNWKGKYPLKPAKNYDKRTGRFLYTTLGLCVPIRVVERECGLIRFHFKFSDRVLGLCDT